MKQPSLKRARIYLQFFIGLAQDWCHDTQHNDIQLNDIQHYYTQHDIQHNGSVVMLSAIMLIVTYKPFMLSIVTLIVVMLSAIALQD